MTDLDKKLVEEGKKLRRYDYWKVPKLIDQAETVEARRILIEIYDELQEAYWEFCQECRE